LGDYTCVAENEVGTSTQSLSLTGKPLELTISKENLPVYSDAIIFEWSTLSGSSIQEINIQVIFYK
jgi:hypothetical protein